MQVSSKELKMAIKPILEEILDRKGIGYCSETIDGCRFKILIDHKKAFSITNKECKALVNQLMAAIHDYPHIKIKAFNGEEYFAFYDITFTTN